MSFIGPLLTMGDSWILGLTTYGVDRFNDCRSQWPAPRLAPIYSSPLMWRMLAPRDSTAPFSLHLDVTDVGRAIVVHAIVGAPVPVVAREAAESEWCAT